MRQARHANAGMSNSTMQTPFGWNVCIWYQPDSCDYWMAEQALALLGPDKWMNYSWWPQTNHPGYVPMIWNGPLSPDQVRDVQTRMRQYPDGETWILINEGHLIEQADMTPAEAVALIYQFNNAGDATGSAYNSCGPNAAINMAAQGPGRLSGEAWYQEFCRWMRRKNLVSLSVNGIHAYNSTSGAMMASIWNRVRRELRRNFIGPAPIVVTEFCAENETYEIQVEVMDEVFRLYQIGRAQGISGIDGILGAFWFAAFDPIGYWPNSALTEIDPAKAKTMRLTPLGRHWKELKARL